MKTMKHIVTGLLIVGMMLAVVGCGGEEKTVTLSLDMSAEMGLPTTDTMILTAKGDTIQQLKEITEVDLADIDDDLKDLFIEVLDEQLAAAQDINGVTCSSKMNGTVYTIEFIVDCTNSAAVKAASEAGLLEIEEGFIDKLSLKRTQDGLTASGYKVVE